MIYPAALKQGDTVALISTARKITPEECAFAKKLLEDKGFKVKLGASLGAEDNQYAGTDAQRAADLQQQLDDDKVKAIFCARGGYGTVRIIDEIDFRKFIKNPKWICGYSDVTVLHSHLHQVYNVASLHCTMPVNFQTNTPESLQSMFNILEGKKNSFTIASHKMSRVGKGEGELVGGNLSLLFSLSGTDSDISTDDKILFIEDIDEYLYHIDRMMMQLKRSGKLENLAGLIVGQFTDMKDNTVPFGKTAYEIIEEAVADYDYPVVFGFPAGHEKDNRAFISGGKYKIYPENDNTVITQL